MTRNSELLASFTEFCQNNPDLRFWQAIGVWSNYYLVLATARPIKMPDTTVMWRAEEVFDPFWWESDHRHNRRKGAQE